MDEEIAREFAALKARCDDLERRLSGALTLGREALALLQKVSAENIGQRVVAAAALAEIALLHSDPRAKISMIGASLLGIAEGAGVMLRQEAETAAHTTKEIEAIVAWAEIALQGPPSSR